MSFILSLAMTALLTLGITSVWTARWHLLRIETLLVPGIWAASAYSFALSGNALVSVFIGAFLLFMSEILLRKMPVSGQLLVTLALHVLGWATVLALGDWTGGAFGHIAPRWPTWMVAWGYMELLFLLWGSVFLARRWGWLDRIMACADDPYLAHILALKPQQTLRITSLFLGGIIGGFGALYAAYRGHVDPSLFALSGLVVGLLGVLVAGNFALWRVVGGAFFLLTLTEAPRFLMISPEVDGGFRLMLAGVAACFIAIFLNQKRT